jgi:hypothetical protein
MPGGGPSLLVSGKINSIIAASHKKKKNLNFTPFDCFENSLPQICSLTYARHLITYASVPSQ